MRTVELPIHYNSNGVTEFDIPLSLTNQSDIHHQGIEEEEEVEGQAREREKKIAKRMIFKPCEMASWKIHGG